MSYSSGSGSSQVVSAPYESNREITNSQASSLMDSMTNYLNNAFSGNSSQTQAVNSANAALANSLSQTGGQNPYLQETIKNIRDNSAAQLASNYASQRAANQGLGEVANQRILSEVVANNNLQQNAQILQALNDSWNADQDRLVNAVQATAQSDPVANLGDTAAALITNLTREWGYQPVQTSSESRQGYGIKN